MGGKKQPGNGVRDGVGLGSALVDKGLVLAIFCPRAIEVTGRLR